MSSAVGLPDPDRRALSRSPLVNVVWQVRFTPTETLSDGKTALRILEKLGGQDKLVPVAAPQLAVQVAAGGPTQQLPQMPDQGGQGWRFSDPDGATHVSINSQSLAVETTQYRTWDGHFYQKVEQAVRALAEIDEVGVVVRVGMRYVNAIFGAAIGADPFSDAARLREIAVEPLQGFLSDDTLGSSVAAYQGHHALKFDDAITSHIQHGIVATDGGELGMLLDIDTFSEETSAFEVDNLLELAQGLHGTGLSVFQRCIKPEALRLMGPQDR